jgi:tetratricopeptide (TPR) repeat protein
LPPRERELMALNRARIGVGLDQSVDIERMARAATERRPDDAPFLLELGEVLFHGNPPRGRSLMEAREPLRRAAQLDPDLSWEPLWHLTQLAALSSDADQLDSLAKRLPSATTEYLTLTTRALQAATRGDRRLLDSVITALRTRPTREAAFASEFALAVSLVRGDTAMARASIAPLTHSDVAATTRGAAWMHLAMLEGALGHWDRVVPAFDQAARLGTADPGLLRARLLTLLAADVPAATRDSARAVLLQRAVSGTTDAGWVRAADLARAGNRTAALALTDTLAKSLVMFEEQRFLRAELLWKAGRRDEALGWYNAASEGPFGLVFFDVVRARRGAR